MANRKQRVGGFLLLVVSPPAALASGRAGCGSTSWSPSHTPRCSLTSPLRPSALPPGWAGHLPGRTEHSRCLCCPLVQVPGSGTPCSQRPGQPCVCVGPPSGSPRSFWQRLWKVETMARMSPGRVMSTSQVARRGTAPCLHAFPARPVCANCRANCCAAPCLLALFARAPGRKKYGTLHKFACHIVLIKSCFYSCNLLFSNIIRNYIKLHLSTTFKSNRWAHESYLIENNS